MKEQVRRLATLFPSDDWPVLECPACRTGTLTAQPGAIESQISAVTKNWSDWGEPTDIQGTFYGHLTCTYPGCGDAIAVSGDMSVDYGPGPHYGPDYSDLFETSYQVRTLYPAIRVVETPEGAPESVVDALLNAAAAAWQNPSAGIGLLRTSVERLMDEQGITATTANGRFRSLHARLVEFDTVNPGAAEPLWAAKWVGNQGVHPANLVAKDFLDVAEFIELALDLLYQKDTSAVRQRIQRIKAAKKLVK